MGHAKRDNAFTTMGKQLGKLNIFHLGTFSFSLQFKKERRNKRRWFNFLFSLNASLRRTDERRFRLLRLQSPSEALKFQHNILEKWLGRSLSRKFDTWLSILFKDEFSRKLQMFVETSSTNRIAKAKQWGGNAIRNVGSMSFWIFQNIFFRQKARRDF